MHHKSQPVSWMDPYEETILLNFFLSTGVKKRCMFDWLGISAENSFLTKVLCIYIYYIYIIYYIIYICNMYIYIYVTCIYICVCVSNPSLLQLESAAVFSCGTFPAIPSHAFVRRKGTFPCLVSIWEVPHFPARRAKIWMQHVSNNWMTIWVSKSDRSRGCIMSIFIL